MQNSWILDITEGYNRVNLKTIVKVKSGSIIRLNTNGYNGRILMDNSGVYSDMIITENSLSAIDTFNRKRFIFNCLVESKFYVNYFKLSHEFKEDGTFALKAIFEGDNILREITRTLYVSTSKNLFKT